MVPGLFCTYVVLAIRCGLCCMANRSLYPLAIGMHYLTYDEARRLPPRSAASTHAVVVALKDATACQMLSCEYYVPWIIP